jgi:hypothetical protein
MMPRRAFDLVAVQLEAVARGRARGSFRLGRLLDCASVRCASRLQTKRAALGLAGLDQKFVEKWVSSLSPLCNVPVGAAASVF